MSNFRLTTVTILLITDLWFCHLKLECNADFAECYNTTTETHCFSKIIKGPVNFYEAQQRCSAIGATLPVIKDDKVQTLLNMFISDLSKSEEIEDNILFYWTNANRFIAANWQWLDSRVINEMSANITTYRVSLNTYVASLHVALQNGSQQEVILTANDPGLNISYICQFVGVDCQDYKEDALRYGDKCYLAFEETATWFDARDRCIGLEESGDLASFGDLKNTGINFTQWLDLSSAKQYWVGVRHLWWMWTKSDSNSEVRYTRWFKGYPVILYNADECVTINVNWGVAAEINGWQTENCSNPMHSVEAICHKVTSFDLPTDSTSSNCPGCANTLKASTTDSTAIRLGVGIGLGLGIPVVIALIVIIVVCVRRKRKPHQNVDTATKSTDDYVMNDPQTDPSESGKDDTTAGAVYWQVAKNDSATSATDEGSQAHASSESDATSGDKIVYSSVAFVEGGESQDDLP